MPFYGDVIKFVVLRVQPEPAAYVSIDTDVIVEATKIEIQRDTYSEHRQPEVGTSPAPYVLLKVAEAKPRDVGHDFVRIPFHIMKKLGIYPGGYVEIVGKKSAYAKVRPAYPEDEDKDIIRMDDAIRQNADVSIGDTVKVKKAALKPAQRVVLVPTEPVIVDPEYLKEQILGKPVARGQAIDVPFYGGTIRFVVRFVVVQVEPEPAAYISIDTDVIITGVPYRHA